MYTNNDPIKSGYAFFKSDLCAADFNRAYPNKYKVSRRGGYGYFCKIDKEELVNGCKVVTTEEYDKA